VKDCDSYIKKSRVLLVDDEPDIVYLVKTRLERNGFEVDAYTDPQTWHISCVSFRHKNAEDGGY
jgi:CheY-like chemotaxis protein